MNNDPGRNNNNQYSENLEMRRGFFSERRGSEVSVSGVSEKKIR
jgi:hypothetical protein